MVYWLVKYLCEEKDWKTFTQMFFLLKLFLLLFFFDYISSENVLLFFLQKKDKWDLQKIMSLFSNPDHVLKRPPRNKVQATFCRKNSLFKQPPAVSKVSLGQDIYILLHQLSFNE